ncbi:MAG TPA: hypothetical protein VGX68_22495 [Thermoanaerobaculia bacterium]|jgi:hypothetical protein|nr:hypothetical protein [Thermoanaerobaculia bacterium]
MSEPISQAAAGGGNGSQQLNKLLGENTVAFHQQFTPPSLTKSVPNPTLPRPGVITGPPPGGTPNQKAEYLANRLAFYHFVQPDPAKAKLAVSDGLGFFQGQLVTGHQCIRRADEALTASHSPIWWRAITSLRITSNALADRGGDYPKLESLVLQWIQFHTSLNSLGEIPSGPNAGKVLVPGARFKGGPGPGPCFCVGPIPKEGLTDAVNNIIYQTIKNGAIPGGVPKKVTTLREEAPDLAGVALAKQIIDSGIGFGEATTFLLPQLRSKMIAQRFSNGHRIFFPDGMPFAGKPALEALADYESGQMCLSFTVGACPPINFIGEPEQTEVEAVPMIEPEPGGPGGGGPPQD